MLKSVFKEVLRETGRSVAQTVVVAGTAQGLESLYHNSSIFGRNNIFVSGQAKERAGQKTVQKSQRVG